MARGTKARRRSCCKQEEEDLDRISKLPTELIESILSRLSVADAVRTSGLSTQWRYNWVTVKNLSFDLYLCKRELSLDDHVRIVQHVLRQHQGSSIDRFVLELSKYYHDDEDDDFTTDIPDLVLNCLQILSQKVVRHVRIKCDSEGEGLDHQELAPLFSCSELTTLKLVEGTFKTPPSFRGFQNLSILKFNRVYFLQDSLEHLVSGSSSLTYLKVKNCRIQGKNLKICSESLKTLVLKHVWECKVEVSANNLQQLVIHLFKANSMTFHSTPFCFLNKLVFKLDLKESGHLPSLLNLLGCAPNLHELQIKSFSIELPVHQHRIIGLEEFSMNEMLDKLMYVRTDILSGSEDELWLIKLLLARSPSLQEMDVVHQLRARRDPQLYGVLMGFPRVSSMVELRYFYW